MGSGGGHLEAGWTTREKRIVAALVLVIFFGLAAINGFYNYEFGFRQF